MSACACLGACPPAFVMNGASCACRMGSSCAGWYEPCWNGIGAWACAVAMAVTSAARVKITSAVMTSAAAECQLVSGSALGGTAGVACWYGTPPG